jgi:hypothetical protein
MGLWGVTKILMGIGCILLGIFGSEFVPLGWTTELLWGKNSGRDGKIPRWIAGPFYVLLGLFVIYITLTGK